MKKLLFTFISMCFILSVFTQSITVTGDWNFTVPADVTEAGLDIKNNYDSAVNQMYMDIEHNSLWKVTMQRYDIEWNDNFNYKVRRTGNGTAGKGQIEGGEKWKEIKNDKADKFFTGENTILNIPFQYKIEGVSVIIPAYMYSTDIIFTLENNY